MDHFVDGKYGLLKKDSLHDIIFSLVHKWKLFPKTSFFCVNVNKIITVSPFVSCFNTDKLMYNSQYVSYKHMRFLDT